MKRKWMNLFFGAIASTLAIGGLASCKGNTVEGAGEAFQLLGLDSLKGDQKVTATFWHSFGDKIEAQLEELVESFETEMTEAGYNIDIELVNKGGGYDGLRSAVNMGTSSNTIPTMILGYPDHFADYISNDILLPLDDFINASNPEIAMSDKDDFIASYWAETQMTIKGETKTAAIPFNKSTEIMTYNSNMVDPILKELGIVENEGDLWAYPTWDDVFKVSQYIQDHKDTLKYKYNGATYDVDKLMNYPVIIDSEANFFITTSRQWGGDGKYTRLNADGSGTIVAKNDSNKAVQEYFTDKAGVPMTEGGQTSGKRLFQIPAKENVAYGSNLLTGRRTFITIGSTAGIKNNASNNYEVKATRIPQKSYDKDAHQAVIQQGTNVAILSKNSNNKTRLLAWMLIKYLTKAENTIKFSKNTGYLPVRTSALNSDEYQNFLKDEDNEFTGLVARAINAAFSQKDYFFTDPAFIGSSMARDKAATLIQDIYCFNKGYDKAMAAYYDTLKKYKIKAE